MKLKSLVFATVVVLTGSLASVGSHASEPKSCQVKDVPSFEINPKPNSYSGFAIVHINNDAARKLYIEMSGVPEAEEENVPEGTIAKKKIGKNLSCFKQILNDCAFYQCNIAYDDLRTGEILAK